MSTCATRSFARPRFCCAMHSKPPPITASISARLITAPTPRSTRKAGAASRFLSAKTSNRPAGSYIAGRCPQVTARPRQSSHPARPANRLNCSAPASRTRSGTRLRCSTSCGGAATSAENWPPSDTTEPAPRLIRTALRYPIGERVSHPLAQPARPVSSASRHRCATGRVAGAPGRGLLNHPSIQFGGIDTPLHRRGHQTANIARSRDVVRIGATPLAGALP